MIVVVEVEQCAWLVQMQAEKFGYPISASQELIAIGASNIVSGVFQGHPVGGPLSRSMLSVSAGKNSYHSQVDGLFDYSIDVVGILRRFQVADFQHHSWLHDSHRHFILVLHILLCSHGGSWCCHHKCHCGFHQGVKQHKL